jgi:hypothetical protein
MADAVIVMALVSRDAAKRTKLSRKEGGENRLRKEGDKWQRRRLPHMVDKRWRIQLKLLS